MGKPILLTVDDDASVLEALVQDLRRHYGSSYRIIRATSGQAALDALAELKRRGEEVALILSDQRMPGLPGVEFLEKSIPLYPEARRALLTAYADTEAAIHAINAAKIHYYLTKPWDPPEERLYAVLDDLLESWKVSRPAAFDGLQVVGSRWLPTGHAIRDFLLRNQIPYRWVEPESTAAGGPEAATKTDALLYRHHLDGSRLPVVIFPDGEALVQPSLADLAQKAGMRVQAEHEFYDLVIAGAGPAGLAAAVYGASEGLKTLVIEPSAPGGQAGSTSKIENYLGFPAGLTGSDLARRATIQARRFGAEFLSQRAAGLRVDGQYRLIQLEGGAEVSCHAALIATGVDYKRMDTPNMQRLNGAGVYYGAAMSEAMACKDEAVFIVGGANSAGQAAVHFAHFSAKVTMLVRGDSLERSMSHYLIHQIAALPNIEVRTCTEVLDCYGEEHLESIRLRTPQGETTEKASALFILIGGEPKTEWLPPEVLRDSKGFVLSGPDLRLAGNAFRWLPDRPPYLLETSVPGVFAAGDVRYASVKRVASAVGQGSIAVQFVHQYLAGF
jgi:thioredoxin reductase (NADPH)